MRLATFNLLHGRSPDDGRVDAARLAAAVRELAADVLALQEVDRDQARSQHLDLTAVAAEAMGAVSVRFVAALSGTPGAWVAASDDERPGTPAYGVALLCRHPVRAWQVVRLPPLPFPAPMRRTGLRPTPVRDEPRVAVVAEVDAPVGPLAVACTHLSFLPGWNLVQLRRLSGALRRHPRAVLAGDLNLRPAAVRWVTGMTPLASGRTFPAQAPDRQIDHLLGRGVRVTGPGRTHALPLSDHRALSVDIG